MKKKFTKILGVGLTLALLCSLLLTAAPVSAVSVPVVTITAGDTGVPPTNPAGVISKLNVYKALFTVGATIPAGGDIVVVFPAGTNITAIATNDVQIISTQGIGGGVYAGTENPVVLVSGAYPAQQTLTITLGGTAIGAGAMVQVAIGTIDTVRCVVNPTTDGTYNLTVATQTAATPAVVIEAAVTSTAYTITVPTISPVPGVVRGYNANDILLYEKTGGTAINDAFAVSGVTKVVVGPGTYDEDVALTVATVTSITSLDGAATTIIKNADAGVTGGTVTLSVKTIFDGFTVVGRSFGVKVDSVAGTTVKNCVLSGATAGALDIDVGTTALPTISTGNTITVATADHGIDLAVGQVATSTSDIFTVAGTGKGIINNGTLTLTGATIGGASGIGFESLNVAAVSTITGTAFSGLDTAVLVTNGATVAVSSSTITGCGRAAVISPAVTALPAIDVVTVATSVTIVGNTIADCVDEILEIDNVAGNSAKVFLNFNTITNPAKGIDNNEAAAATVDATNNLWDGGVAPPVTMAPLSATTGMIDTTPYLIAAVSNTKIAVGAATLTAKTTAGVNVTATKAGAAPGTNPAAMAAASYAANPGAAAVPGVASAYYDVYVNSTGTDADTYTVSLFGTVTADTKAYVWGAGLGKWVLCSPQTVNVFAGSITITVTATSTPTLTDLAGLPLAIADPVPTTVLATAPTILAPTTGDDTVSLTPTFAWEAVTGADGYYFQLADNANFVAPMVKLDGDMGRLIVTAYAYVTELPYSTAYYWRVKAVSGTAAAGDLLESAWVSGLFITKAEPEEPIPPIVIEPTPPAPAPIIEPIVEVITPPATPITPAWIYAIIGVGAVLVIALLVLIVRTRRVA